MNQHLNATASSFDQENPSMVCCDLCRSAKREMFAPAPDGHYYRCVECGLIYSIADAAQLPSFYNDTYYSSAASTWYAGRVSAGESDQPHWSPRWHRKSAKRLASFEAYRQNGTFLEIGCSLGDFLNVINRAGWNAVGIEISDAAAGYARDKWNLDVRTGTLETVAPVLTPNSFDVIWAANLLEHVVSPSRFLAEIQKLLRPGGILIASTLNFNSWACQFSGSRWEYLFSAREHRFVFSPELLTRYCTNNGLTIEQTVTTGFRCISKTKKREWYSPIVRLFEQGVSNIARPANQGHRVQFWARKPESAVAAQLVAPAEHLRRAA